MHIFTLANMHPGGLQLWSQALPGGWSSYAELSQALGVWDFLTWQSQCAGVWHQATVVGRVAVCVLVASGLVPWALIGETWVLELGWELADLV